MVNSGESKFRSKFVDLSDLILQIYGIDPKEFIDCELNQRPVLWE